MHVLLGLGGNLGDPPEAFRTALGTLQQRHRLVVCSGLYRTDPVGPPQPRYWNMVAVVDVAVPLHRLLHECHEIEAAAGRQRVQRWGARTLDLDLLLGADLVVRSDELLVPHPELHRRAFVLIPALEIVPEWRHPMLGESIAELAERVGNDGVVRVS